MIACEASTWPIGDASGGQPVSARIRSSSSSTSSSRSPAPSACSEWSIPATTLAGRSWRAASTAMRGTSGVTSSSPMCSSTRSVASQSASTSTPGSSPARERLGERLARDPVEGQRERIDRAGDELRARAGRGERGGERAAAGSLRVDPDREAARLGERVHELLRRVRLQRAGRIVEEDAHRSELRQHLRALDQRLDLAGAARAVDEPGLEVALRGDDRLRGLAQVRDVVERVVEPEDVDPVLGGGGDEAAGEVGVDGTGADEEAAAQREPERRLDARLEGADPLPRALDAALDGGVEAAAARDLEVREAGPVEDLGEPELLGSGNPPGERLLPEQANGRVGERRHLCPLRAGKAGTSAPGRSLSSLRTVGA